MNNINKIASLLILFPFFVSASESLNALADLDFDELIQMEITSVSKKSEKLSEAAAAVYVVTEDEIRRSGATSIPEALRLVPGVDAVQIDPNKWAISIRGFNGRFANKLLVLIDGRSVYTPTYSGVYWEYLDYLMADIARIEVIRGPGATLWGTNAVNGVINIITKEAAETQGGVLAVAAGNELKGQIAARQGFETSENTQVRVYAKGKSIDESQDSSGAGQDNGGDYLQAGFRIDNQPRQDQSLTFQGNLFKDKLGQQLATPLSSDPYYEIDNDDVDALGGDLDIRWSQILSLDSELNVNVNYDFYDHQAIQYNERRDTLDFSVQHQFSPFSEHEVVWGGGYRWSKNDVDSSELVLVSDSVEYINIWNLFVQDTVRFPVQNISVTLGTKLEGNSYTGSELQPNLRVSWVPTSELTLWGAISRAIRTPSRVETDSTVNASFFYSDEYYSPVMVQVVGNDNFESEQLDAYEFGVRWVPLPRVSLDLATFYNNYENLRSYDLEVTYPSVTQPYILAELDLDNTIQGHSSGFELLATWQASDISRFRFVYSFIDIQLKDTNGNEYSGNAISSMSDRGPKHQVSLWGDFEFSKEVDLALRVYYISERSWSAIEPDDTIADVVDADIRLAWQYSKSLELSLVGNNLLHDERQQFQAEDWASASYIERSVFAKAVVTW